MTLAGGFVDGSGQGDLTLTPEVCVVGSGAGGAVAAFHLQQAGHEVLVVEEGGHYTRKDFHMTEAESFPTLYQEGGQRTTEDLGVLFLQGRAVGGTTVINWTTCFRTPDDVMDHWRVHHAVQGIHAGVLNPHWEAIEERLHIHKVPLHELNRNNRLLYDGCKAMGWDVATTRRNARDCQQTGYCGMGCPVDAKQSMLVTYLPDAVALGTTVLSRCRVDRFHLQGRTVTHATGHLLDAEGIKPTGRTVTIKARRFILSAGAMGSPAILLRSGVPDTVVGKRTFLHPVVVSSGLYADPVLACYGAPQSAASHEFSHRGDDVGFVLEAAPLHPVLMATALSGLGQEHRDAMVRFAHVAPHIALMIDGFHPSETGGTVKLRTSGAPVLDYVMPTRIQDAMRQAQKRMAELQFATGATQVVTGHDPAVVMHGPREVASLDRASFRPLDVFITSAHVMGGCAMGEDRRRAFVRSQDLRAHDFDNLHVVDGSVFPTSLGVNPQETIYGLARLASMRMASSWGSG